MSYIHLAKQGSGRGRIEATQQHEDLFISATTTNLLPPPRAVCDGSVAVDVPSPALLEAGLDAGLLVGPETLELGRHCARAERERGRGARLGLWLRE